jgi:hypothetical protein
VLQTRGKLARRARRIVGRFVRRFGLLPATMPDRLGQDAELAGSSLSETVMVYFPDTRESLYQLRQWYAPIKKLHEKHPVVVVLQDSRTARVVRAESGLRCLTIAKYGAVDDLLARSNVKLALYVNHNPQNFANLRFLSLVHVHLSHGDSDKGVSVSNQIKGYDFNFVAGQAAVDRVQQYTMLYDAKARTIPIGRPQLDFAGSVPADPSPRPTVLYCPTWEGAQPSMAYSSVATHGSELLGALLDSGRYRVIYRPHPLTGVTDETIGLADIELRRMVREAAAAQPHLGHRIDTERPLAQSFAASDLMICDVSGVPIDYLPSGKPLVITTPASPDVVVARTRLLDSVPRLDARVAAQVVDVVSEQLEVDPDRQQRLDLIEYYLGDTTPGAATRRFIAACEDAMALRDAAWGEVRARGPAGP